MPGDNDMTEEQLSNMTSSDHDLLITVHEQVKQIRLDIRELSSNFAGRLDRVEVQKLSQTDAQQKFLEIATVQKDHESRIRTVEGFVDNIKGKYAIVAVIAGIILTIATSLMTSYLIKSLNNCSNNCQITNNK